MAITRDELLDLAAALPSDQRLWLKFKGTFMETASIHNVGDALGFFAKLTEADPNWTEQVTRAEYRAHTAPGSYVRTIVPLPKL